MHALLSPQCLDGKEGALSLIQWSSHKVRRVCRSTLAAETMSALEAQGVLEWCKCLWAEMRSRKFDLMDRDTELQKMASLHIVDAKSLFDFLIHLNFFILSVFSVMLQCDFADPRI